MDADYFRLLFDYNRWANERVLDAAAGLSDAEYAKELPGGRTIRGTLTHILGAEEIWVRRCRGLEPAPVREDDYPTLASLRERWRQAVADQTAYLATLKPEDVDRDLTYRSPQGQEFTYRVALLFTQVLGHSNQTRSEAAVALTDLGHSPGALDFLVYLREKQSA